MSSINNKVATNILSLIQNIHTIAKENPEALDIVLTNDILILAIQDLDYKMNDNLKNYAAQKVQFLSLSENNSQKEFIKEQIKISRHKILSYYNLYQSYELIKNSRNISDNDIELITDINTVKMILIQEGLLQPEFKLLEKVHK